MDPSRYQPIHHQHRHLDVACDLDAGNARAQVGEWERLQADYGLGAEVVPGGARLWLRAEARSAAEELVAREAACCGFLDIDLVAEGDRLRVELTSPAPAAAPVIAALAGVESTG